MEIEKQTDYLFVYSESEINSTRKISYTTEDATLDEVVLASQEMFMEGTRNLIQTIQEKIYRDIYHKEAELKAREEMLNQREKMLNDQMMSMMSNFASMQQVAIAAVQKPTKVEVESDKQ